MILAVGSPPCCLCRSPLEKPRGETPGCQRSSGRHGDPITRKIAPRRYRQSQGTVGNSDSDRQFDDESDPSAHASIGERFSGRARDALSDCYEGLRISGEQTRENPATEVALFGAERQ
jgi:hypothetical protein